MVKSEYFPVLSILFYKSARKFGLEERRNLTREDLSNTRASSGLC